jgi:hypothetical protein
MGSLRTKWRWLRLAVAGLLAVISLVQSPSMVVAWSSESAPFHQHSVMSHGHHATLQSSHQHHAPSVTDDAFLTDDGTYSPFACHIVCCCLTLSLAFSGAPSAFDVLLGALDSAAAPVMVPAPLDPADPPPRFLS